MLFHLASEQHLERQRKRPGFFHNPYAPRIKSTLGESTCNFHLNAVRQKVDQVYYFRFFSKKINPSAPWYKNGAGKKLLTFSTGFWPQVFSSFMTCSYRVLPTFMKVKPYDSAPYISLWPSVYSLYWDTIYSSARWKWNSEEKG